MSTAAPRHTHRPLSLDRRTPEGLMLDLIAEQAEIASIRQRLDQDGRAPTMAEQAKLINAEAEEEEVKAELLRRIKTVLGTVEIRDLIRRGVIQCL